MIQSPSSVVVYDTERLAVVGTGALMLRRSYDLNQLWLDLGQPIIFPAPTSPPPPAPKPPPGDGQMYHYEPGVPQHVLPFHEFRRVSKKQYKLLATAGFPAWDRGADGKPLRVPVACSTLTMSTWCLAHCTGRYVVKPRLLIFEKARDAVLAKMHFS